MMHTSNYIGIPQGDDWMDNIPPSMFTESVGLINASCTTLQRLACALTR
ncbi:Uncharacterised protein [Mycolicibacterium phlei]|nr:Uncharacterised protein [Mycolicibacterium phlei]